MATETVGSALSRLSGAPWVAVVDTDGAPICVAAADDLALERPEQHLHDLVLDYPPFVVVDDQMPVGEAVQSTAFRTMNAETPVLVRGRDALAGVWAGEDLAEAVLANIQGRRFASDATLPGSVSIPQIVRLCGFAYRTRSCLDRRTFAEKPDLMPPCRNPMGLTAHAFVW